MAHILSVEDNPSAVMVPQEALRARGHTVDEALDGEEGLLLARRSRYDVIVANRSMPRMNGDAMLDAVPLCENGLPIRVLQTHGGGVHAEHRGRFDFAIDDGGKDGLLLSTIQAAIDVAVVLVKAHLVRSAPRSGGRDRMDPWWGRVPTSQADGPRAASLRQSAEGELRRRVRLRGAPPGEVRWFHGPLSACRFLREEYGGSTYLARPDVAASEGEGPLVWLRRREAASADAPAVGLAPTWAGLERVALRNRLSAPGATVDGDLEALLLHANRGVGIHDWQRVIGAREAEGLSAVDRTGLHQVWWWLLEDGNVIAADPPVGIHVDRGGAPHSTTRSAVWYSDGLDVFALHGRQVDAELIAHPERITVDTIRACTDAELRRALRELYGDVRYLTDTGAKLVHMDTVPVDGLAPGSRSITRALFEDDEGHRFLVASDGSTSRVYHMRVPRSCSTCAEAYVALSGREGVRTILEA